MSVWGRAVDAPSLPEQPLAAFRLPPMIVLALLGAMMFLAGVVWLGQGVGLIGGSFMSGHALWAVIGAMLMIFGIALIRGWWRARSAG